MELIERNDETDVVEVGLVDPDPSCFGSEITYPSLAQISMNFCAASVFVVSRCRRVGTQVGPRTVISANALHIGRATPLVQEIKELRRQARVLADTTGNIGCRAVAHL